eukprot:scaffold5357_cov150-Skeletonema_menzelii.AAC.9
MKPFSRNDRVVAFVENVVYSLGADYILSGEAFANTTMRMIIWDDPFFEAAPHFVVICPPSPIRRRTGYWLATDGTYYYWLFTSVREGRAPHSGLELAAFIMLECIFTTRPISRLIGLVSSLVDYRARGPHLGLHSIVAPWIISTVPPSDDGQATGWLLMALTTTGSYIRPRRKSTALGARTSGFSLC